MNVPSRHVATIARGISATAVLLICSLGTVHGAGGGCATARVDDPIRLPDGSAHPPGEITICWHGDYSPVLSLHKTLVDRGPASLLMSRRTEAEGPEIARPAMIFTRQPGGALLLRAYAVPRRGRTETYRFFVSGVGKGARSAGAQTFADGVGIADERVFMTSD